MNYYECDLCGRAISGPQLRNHKRACSKRKCVYRGVDGFMRCLMCNFARPRHKTGCKRRGGAR
jgi:hypothetical protein